MMLCKSFTEGALLNKTVMKTFCFKKHICCGSIVSSVKSFQLFLPRYLHQRASCESNNIYNRSKCLHYTLPNTSNYRPLGFVFIRSLHNESDPKQFRSTNGSSNGIYDNTRQANRRYALYVTAGVCLSIGMAYAAAPLYKVFCQTTNMGGELDISLRDEKAEKLSNLDPVKEYGELKINFRSARNARMLWEFHPQQQSIRVFPGETALAFYTATNPTDRPIIGVSTYNIIPYDAAPYFNKIQCFCFEDQRLEPHETVDMPVFFYIDPDIVKDAKCRGIKEITLAYTFFESNGSLDLNQVVPPANTPGVAKLFEKDY